MERDPGKPDKKKRQDRIGVPLPAFLAAEEQAMRANPENTQVAGALASLLVEKKPQEKKKKTKKEADRKPSESTEQAKEKSKDTPKPNEEADEKKKAPEEHKPDSTLEDARLETVEDKEDAKDLKEAEEDDEDEDDETYDPLPSHELGPRQLNGGEVIILRGGSVAEEKTASPEAEQNADQEQPAGETPEPEATQQAAPAEQLEELQPQPPTQEELQPPVAAGGGGEVPPIIPPEAPSVPFEQPEERPQNTPYFTGQEHLEPAQAYREYIQRQMAEQQEVQPMQAAHTATKGEQYATKEELEDAVYYATKAGQNRGVVTGLLVGGAYEHFKHKRREKRNEKRYKAQQKQLESARQDYRFSMQEQEKRQAETSRQLNAAEKQLHAAEQRLENHAHPENHKNHAEKPAPRRAEVARDPAEQLAIPADHRLETSAWHSIEVDAKTGKAVEQPAFAYGQEYYRERAHETKLNTQQKMDAGEVALTAAATGQSAGSGSTSRAAAPGTSTSLPPVQIPDATTQGVPSARPGQDAKPAQKPGKPTGAATPLWPWLIALAIVIIWLIALLG